MLFAASICLLASFPYNRKPYVPMPEYRPAFLAKTLAGARCDGVRLDEGSFRGRRPIESRWTLRRPFRTVGPALRKETVPEIFVRAYDDEALGRRGAVTTYQKLSDRMVEIFLEKGRIVKVKRPGFAGELRLDEEEYVTATVTERPLYFGRLPRPWLPAAAKAPNLPAAFPGVPIPDLDRPPAHWRRDVTPGRAQQYWVTWYVHESPKVAMPRILRDLERTGDWKVGPPKTGDDVRCTPKRKPSPFGWLSVSHNRYAPPDVSPDITLITATWVDAK